MSAPVGDGWRRDPARASRWFVDSERRRISTEHDNTFTRWCAQYTVGALMDHFRDRQPASILDIGCGTGELLQQLRTKFPGAALAGTDPDRDAVDIARTTVPQAYFDLATAESLDSSPLASRTFDAIVVQLNLALWNDPERGLSNIVELLDVGGLCYVVDPVADDTAHRCTSTTDVASAATIEDYIEDQAAASFTLAEADELGAALGTRFPVLTVRVSAGGVFGYPTRSPEARRIWQHNRHVREALLASDRSSDADLLYMHITRQATDRVAEHPVGHPPDATPP